VATIGGLGALWLFGALVLTRGAPVGVVASGAVIGGATALTAIGLVLMYRSNHVVNFAYGAMGAATGLSAANLFLTWGWPYPVALGIGVVTGAALGAVVEFVVIRRFAKSSRLILSVATIGLAQALGGVEILLPERIFGNTGPVTLGGYVTPLSSTKFEVGSTIIDGNHLLIVAVVPIAVVLLALFLKRSAAGMAIRAAAENEERARLLGIPVGRISLMVWAIAGGLATLTFLLKAPFAGTPPTAVAGPAVLLPALAAALLARMESLPVAGLAAVVLGAVDQVTRWNSSTPAVADVVLFVVILGSLLVQQRGRSRARELGGTWQDVATSPPLPDDIRRLPEMRIPVRVGAAAALVIAVLLPNWFAASTVQTLSIAAIWGMVALSLVVLTGWGGQISLGQFAFVGVGAVVAGNLLARWNVDLFVAMAAAALAAALVALALGFPALRIRGPFLGVVTLSFAVVFDGYLLNPNVLPDIIPSTVERPVLLQRWPLEDGRTFYWLCLALLLFVGMMARSVRQRRSGRLLVAVRDNPRAADAAGVPGRWVALSGFIFAGTIAGLAGALNVVALNGVGTNAFQPIDSVDVFSWTTIGGLSSVLGGAAATMGIRLGRAWVDPAWKLLLSGAALLVILWAIPGGVAAGFVALRDRYVRWVCARRGIARAGLAAPTIERPPPLPRRAMTVPPLLTARRVSAAYGQLRVLFDVDLDVQQGEIVALLGTNGAGKSTVLKCIAGLLPGEGSAHFGDLDLRKRSPEEIVRAGVALMPGGKSIFPTLSVTEHLRLSTWTFRSDHDRVTQDTERVLDLFPVLRTRSATMAGDLSGGEQQQLALAMTLLLRPHLLLIDELSLGLSPSIVGQLLEVVRAVNRNGTTIVVVEQSINVALSLAERAVFMEKGQVRFSGPTADLLERDDILRSVFIDGATAGQAPTQSAGEPDGLGDTEERSSVMEVDLRSLDTLGSLSAGDDRDGPVLECLGIVKRFGGVTAVDHVDLAVQPGEIVGLIGQNGAGKTTIVDCISGFHALDGGVVGFRGRNITEWQPHERALSRLGRSFQEARLFPSLTVAETISVARERHVDSRALVADALRQPASHESELAVRQRVDELIALVNLGDYRDKLTAELSTGTRRIVELACLLAAEPVLLLLDEPSAGVAQRETEALGPMLRRIRDVTGVAMVIIEHDMGLIGSTCDRLVALELGSVIATGTPTEVLNNPAVIASYLGTDQRAINRSGALV
jgi:ABC-type branched-subunit amino acid transport system ATPase component/ABC-type branched-subunit amino acid transport system permease subunit